MDCAAPALNGLTAMRSTLDMLARCLAELEMNGKLPKYKAVLEATRCDDMARALTLADELDQYTFDPDLLDASEVAAVKLEQLLGGDMVKQLLPHVQLCAFGSAIIQAGGGKLTGYGYVQPIIEPAQVMEQNPAQRGMEAMQ